MRASGTRLQVSTIKAIRAENRTSEQTSLTDAPAKDVDKSPTAKRRSQVTAKSGGEGKIRCCEEYFRYYQCR